MGFFSQKPRFYDQKLTTVADVQDKIKAFNVLFEVGSNGSANNCKDPHIAAQWRKGVREGVINVHGSPMELDFMEQIAGGKRTDIDTTDLYTKTNIDMDLNIMAQSSVTGNAPGAATTFIMHRSLYAGGGKYSNVAKGGSIYLYEDRQWVYVDDVDRTVDYAHAVRVYPYSKDYTVNIRGGNKMMFSPVRLVDGVSCPAPSSTWMTNGYISRVRPMRVRKDWKVEVELLRPYQDKLQFAIIFDENGKEIDSWEYKEKIEMRKDLKWRKNLDFFIGQSIDNPALLGNIVSEKYSGFEGYVPTIEYAGGTVYDFDAVNGYDLDADFQALIIRQDAIKQTSEFVGMDGKLFRMAMERRMADAIKNSSGSCSFQAFERTGSTEATSIKKMGVQSYYYAGMSLHFKNISALSDTRGIGNGDFPYMCMLMPGDNIKDSKGNIVPAIEVYNPGGSSEAGTYQEFERDKRQIDGCEVIEGHAVETYMAGIHAPERHILLRPQRH